MRDGYRIYDTHTHLGTARHSGRQWTVDEMLRHMDRHGIDKSLLIPFPVVDDYRATHDLIATAVRAHADRFAGTACLYPFMPEQEFRDEIRRAAEELGFRALKLQPQYQALNPLSPRSDFLFETALRHKLVVIVHTGAGAPFALPSLYIVPARKFPDLPIVLGHAGGGIYAAESVVAALVCPNVYVELSSLMPHHMREVFAHVPSSRLMIGTDVPESSEAELVKVLAYDMPDDSRRDILWRTARKLFDGVAD